MERIGLLGGTFDPPHLGHLWLAETAAQQLALDRIFFLPVGQPPHKDNAGITTPDHRLAMTRLAVDDNPKFICDTLDISRQPPHYTLTLLAALRRREPESDYWLLIGSDSLAEMPTWHQPRDILPLARLAVLPRPGVQIDWVNLSQSIPGIDAVVDFLDGPMLSLSATVIRTWLKAGRSVRYLVPQFVLNYILLEGLYGD